jgi:hypothetical protein
MSSVWLLILEDFEKRLHKNKDSAGMEKDQLSGMCFF